MGVKNLEQLKKDLLDIGAKESDLDNIIKDVDTIIVSKILALYESLLGQEQKATLKLIKASHQIKL